MTVKATCLTAAIVLALSTLCFAQPGPAAATATGETGLFNLLSGETLPNRTWSVGFYYNNWDRLLDVDDALFGTSDDLEFDWDRLSASFAYGLNDRWEASVMFPFYDNFQFHHDELLIGQQLDGAGPNNIRVATNYRFFANSTMDSAASVNGFVELPTGDSDVASDEHGFGATLAARMREYVFNLGYRDPGNDDDFDNPQEVIVAGGYARPITDRFRWISELTGTFVVGGQEDAIDLRHAVDLISGGRLMFPDPGSPWMVNFGVRFNLNGLSGVGGMIGVTYGKR